MVVCKVGLPIGMTFSGKGKTYDSRQYEHTFEIPAREYIIGIVHVIVDQNIGIGYDDHSVVVGLIPLYKTVN